MTPFPDISFYQGHVDFGKMREKTDRVIIRLGQGKWFDVKASDNMIGARDVGLLIGAYWFYDDRVSPLFQANLVRSALEVVRLDLPIFCDWENTYRGKYGGLKNVVAFMQTVEKICPSAVVGMYTGYYWFAANTHPIKNYFQYRYLKTRPLWLAWYAEKYEKVKVPMPWTVPLYWQYGTPEVDMGQTSKEIDMNQIVEEINVRRCLG